MKRIFAALLVVTSISQAQVPVRKNIFQEEIQEIAAKESRIREKLLQRAAIENLSVASNNFNVHYYRCEWNVDPAILYINGKVTSHFRMLSASNNITYDLHQSLTVDSILYHGSKITFQQTPAHALIVQFPASINAGVNDSVSIFYRGIPDASGFGSFVRTVHGSNIPVMWTLSEPYGAKEWWPCKNGLTDKTDSIDIIITHPTTYTASSNGRLVSEIINGASKTTTYKHRYPIATYLVAIAVTNYQVSTDTVQLSVGPLEYKGYYYPESFADFKNYESFSKEFLVLFSNLFVPYPFAKEKYAQTQFSWGGGMEHQTNSFMGSRSPNLQSHELMHQWFGDMVTCGSWSDLWLNEGFATYGTALSLEYNYPTFHRDFLRSLQTSVFSASTGSVYITDTLNIGRLFNSRLTYNKAAYVVHMLRWKLGDSMFYGGVRRYLTDPLITYGFAKTEDLKRNLEAESGIDLDTFFEKWVYGEGHTNYSAEWSQNINGWVSVKLSQLTSHPSVSFYDMPVELELRGSGGNTKRVVVDHRFNQQRFSMNADFQVDTIVIDPDLWLLANIKVSVKGLDPGVPNDILIYPNPFPDNLNIVIRNPTETKLGIQFINMLGQILFTRTIDLAGNDETLTFETAHLPKGMYFLAFKGEKGFRKVERVIKR